MYRSDDAGATWRKVNNANPRPMYFSKVRIDPNDPEVVYLGGVDLHQTLDGGKTINTAAASRTHSDHHAIWVNPANSNHVLIGNDGGLAVSYDMSKTWNFLPNLPVGLFYHVSYDMATPYNVCGGMQDNYSWCGPSQVRGTAGIANHHWATVQGGDGFVVLQDPTTHRIAYSESQDGNIVRLDRVTFESMSIRPAAGSRRAAAALALGHAARAFAARFEESLYAAANKVFRSADKGLSWVAVSQDLTTNQNREDVVTMGVKGSEVNIAKNDGIAAWPAIVSFAESPKRAGVLYAGTDDGNLAVTRDAGKTWTQVIEKVSGVPKGIYVSEVVPSRFDEGTVYVTFDGHRQNDFETYIYASNDFGQTWRSAAANLKGEIARTLTEDLKNPDVLYLGTETGLFVSLDRAKSWQRLKANLPTVRIDEITLHPRDNAMILATHGRTIWILDNLAPIQEYTAAQTTDSKWEAVFARPDRDVQAPGERSQLPVLGRSDVLRREPAAGGGHLVAPQESGRERAVEDRRCRRPRGARDLRAVLANSNRAGIQSACWDLRVQPAPASGRGATRPRRAGRTTRRTGGAPRRIHSARDAAVRGRRRARWLRWRRRRTPARTSCRAPTPSRSCRRQDGRHQAVARHVGSRSRPD